VGEGDKVRSVMTQYASSRDPLLLGVDLFIDSWWVTLPAALFAVLVGQLPAAYAAWQGLPLALNESKDVAWWLLMAAAILINLWAWLFIMHRQAMRLIGRSTTVGAAMLAAAKALLPASQALTLMWVLIVIGSLALVIPGIYLLVVGWLVLPAVVSREGSARVLIDGCLQSARGQWWVLAKGLLLTLIGIMALFVVGNVLGLLLFELSLLVGPGALTDDALGQAMMSVIGGMLGALYMPFASAMAVAHEALLTASRQSSANSSL
jgi:hypothetical protein